MEITWMMVVGLEPEISRLSSWSRASRPMWLGTCVQIYPLHASASWTSASTFLLTVRFHVGFPHLVILRCNTTWCYPSSLNERAPEPYGLPTDLEPLNLIERTRAFLGFHMKMSWLTLVKLALSLAIVRVTGVAGVLPRGASTGPDPSLAVSISLNGETYINKVKQFLIRSSSRLLIESRL